jgi:F0F1-type ATP synthase assembly protein I
MAPKSPEPQDFGFYLQLSQVGLEMAMPVVLGVFADRWLGSTPWLMIVGAMLGLFGGLVHLLVLLKRHDRDRPSPPTRDAP